mmetsp:Transcript_5367/g.14387  ORF Transcript_5367/g.14387 Transcript_5367/m.14387 type:complete len:201 (+) Transcript_5367:985-1587(+)
MGLYVAHVFQRSCGRQHLRYTFAVVTCFARARCNRIARCPSPVRQLPSQSLPLDWLAQPLRRRSLLRNVIPVAALATPSSVDRQNQATVWRKNGAADVRSRRPISLSISRLTGWRVLAASKSHRLYLHLLIEAKLGLQSYASRDYLRLSPQSFQSSVSGTTALACKQCVSHGSAATVQAKLATYALRPPIAALNPSAFGS